MTRRNQLVGRAIAMVAGKRPTTLTLYLTQRQDRALSPTTESYTSHWLDPSAKAKSDLSLKTHVPSNIEIVNNTADTTLCGWP